VAEQLEPDPLTVLSRWVGEAAAAGLPVPSTMTLATAGPDGPHARTVLVTTIDGGALRFHSSTPTGKTRDLAADPRASGVFHWPALGRQAILTGTAIELDAAASLAAYPTRPRQLQLLAWAYEALLPRAVRALRGGPGRRGSGLRRGRRRPRLRGRPASWTTIELTPTRIDLWQAGTEATPPTKTRYDRVDGAWTGFPVLP